MRLERERATAYVSRDERAGQGITTATAGAWMPSMAAPAGSIRKVAADRDVLRPVDLGRAIGLSAQQARRYEEWGFLPPAERSATGHRRYSEQHLHAVLAVRAMQAGYGWRTGGRVMRHLHQGELATALELVDACHAKLHQRRREVEETLEVLRVLASAAPVESPHPRSRRAAVALRVGDAAKLVGVRISSLHFWEEQRLLSPRRDSSSGYRLYDPNEVLRLRVVVILRKAGYTFDAIRTVLDELAGGRPSTALSAIERRREELQRASERCSRATAAFWSYVSEVFGKPHALSGSLSRTALT